MLKHAKWKRIESGFALKRKKFDAKPADPSLSPLIRLYAELGFLCLILWRRHVAFAAKMSWYSLFCDKCPRVGLYWLIPVQPHPELTPGGGVIEPSCCHCLAISPPYLPEAHVQPFIPYNKDVCCLTRTVINLHSLKLLCNNHYLCLGWRCHQCVCLGKYSLYSQRETLI